MLGVKEGAVIKPSGSKVLDSRTYLNNKTYSLSYIESFCPTHSCTSYTRSGDNSSVTNHCCFPCSLNTCNGGRTQCKSTGRKMEALGYDTDIETPTYNCVKTYCGNQHLSLSGDGYYGYLLLQSCPNNENQTKYSETVRKCIIPNAYHLNELIPVYSRTTGVNYRNIYCAKCNNDYLDTIMWESKITGKDLFSIYITIALERNMKYVPTLFLQMKPPSTATAEPCADVSGLITECPRHNGQKEYQNLCHNSKIHNPVKGINGVYKNAYCLACNENLDSCFINKYQGAEKQKSLMSVEVDTEVLAAAKSEETDHSLRPCTTRNDHGPLLVR